jgi:maleylpyruvate isomerase
MTEPHTWDALHAATQRLIRTVDALPDTAYAEPSALPGWSRAHVVAHLALNGEGLAGVLQGLATGDDTPMYASQQSRDSDIETLAAQGAAALRDRLLAGCSAFQAAWEHMTDAAWAGEFRRTPDSGTWPAAALPRMRHGELEIHHADLLAGYSAAHWPEAFLDDTFNRIVGDREDGPAMLLRTPDGDVPLGEGGPVVTGSRADLTWWLLGRGDGQGLTGDPALPTLAPWR